MILIFQRYITITFYILLSLTFLLYGMHSKELASLSSVPRFSVDAGAIAYDGGAKLANDLHHHMDKQTLKSLIKYSSETLIQIEARRFVVRKVNWHRTHMASGFRLWLDYIRIKFSFLAKASKYLQFFCKPLS